MTAWNSPFLASNQWNSIIIIWHLLPLLTREVIKSGGDVFGGVSIRRVADNQAGFTHRSVPEKDALQQPLLWLTRPRGHGTVWGHRGSHGASVIHGDRKGTVRSNQAKEPAWEQESVWLRRSRVALVRKNYRPALYALPDPVRPTDSRHTLRPSSSEGEGGTRAPLYPVLIWLIPPTSPMKAEDWPDSGGTSSARRNY